MKNNRFVLLKKNGEIIENPMIEGLKVDFFGSGNTVEIEEGAVFHNCHFKMRERCKIFIAKSHKRWIKNTVIDMAGSYDGFIKIDKGTSIESCRFAMANERKPYVYIGKNCMLSSNIVFRASDGHAIYDLESKKIINKPKPINIQDHVWIGASVIILKGTTVSKNSIIAIGSVVTKCFSEENIIIAGNPAIKVKEKINWDKMHVRDCGEYFED